MDKISSKHRSWNMSRIRSINTIPEVLVRKILRQMNLRYRKNVKNLPGKPDIYISKIKTAVFIHGCFWHQHAGCKRKFMPKSKIDYWKPKLERNVARFKEHTYKLESEGISTIVIWECETKKRNPLEQVIKDRLVNFKNHLDVSDGL